MKRYISLLILVWAICPAHLAAQVETEDVIYFKNGSIYRGIIDGQLTDSSFQIRIFGGSTIVVRTEDIREVRREPKLIVLSANEKPFFKTKREPIRISIETDMSYILYFDDATYFGEGENKSQGGGISLLPEFRRIKHFSILTGISVNYIFTRNYVDNFGEDYTSVDKGYQIRFEVPIWFRWSFGSKVPWFFQFGWGIGGDFYRGWGTYSYDGGFLNVTNTYGWQKVNIGYMDVISLGIGIRKPIAPGTELISYLQISPVDMQFAGAPYTPYLQFHIGFNLSGKKKMDNEVTKVSMTR